MLGAEFRTWLYQALMTDVPLSRYAAGEDMHIRAAEQHRSHQNNKVRKKDWGCRSSSLDRE